MTDREIIQALECCIKPTRDCENCPYYRTDECFDIAKRDALNLIVRQQADFENSVKATKHWHREAELNANEIIKLQAEIERLTINMNAFGLGMKQERERADTIKAEAIKEFADILAEKFIVLFNLEYNQAENLRMIVKHMAKEMVGEDK